MDLRSVYYFVRIADLGSVTSAAAHLNIAQPALSRHIRRLEEELAVTLFHRASRGVTLTDAGSKLYGHAVALLRDFERVRDEMKSYAERPAGKFKLGVVITLTPLLVPPLISRLRAEFPEVSLTVVENVGVQLEEWLLEGRLDAAVTTDRDATPLLVSTPLIREEMVFVTAPGTRRHDITLGELARTPLIMNDGLRRLTEQVLARPTRLLVDIELNAFDTARLMVSQGLGSTIVPHGFVWHDCLAGKLDAHRITENGVYRRVVVAAPASRHLSRVGEVVVQRLQEIAAELDAKGAFSLTSRPRAQGRTQNRRADGSIRPAVTKRRAVRARRKTTPRAT